MNLVLFAPHELGQPLPLADRRAKHVLEVLRRNVGDTFDAGEINGSRGKATLTSVTAEALAFTYQATTRAIPPPPLTLIVGLPRPQTARDILRDATSLGVAAIHFVRTEKAEPSYAQSTLWSSDEWQRQVLAGAEQAFATDVPRVTHGRTLDDVLSSEVVTSRKGAYVIRAALDNYESAEPMYVLPVPPQSHVVLAIGSERGWSAAERDALRHHNFMFVHLGSRVLRTETAVVAALTIAHAKLDAVSQQ